MNSVPIPKEIEELFYASKRGNIVRFGINDAVKIIAGENSGLMGAVISIFEVDPEVILIVERGDTGSFIQVKQSQLVLVE